MTSPVSHHTPFIQWEKELTCDAVSLCGITTSPTIITPAARRRILTQHYRDLSSHTAMRQLQTSTAELEKRSTVRLGMGVILLEVLV